jgi:hypothetical protein
MLVPHRQQSATISHSRTDIGAPQSGHEHITASPTNQKAGLADSSARWSTSAGPVGNSGNGSVEVSERQASPAGACRPEGVLSDLGEPSAAISNNSLGTVRFEDQGDTSLFSLTIGRRDEQEHRPARLVPPDGPA